MSFHLMIPKENTPALGQSVFGRKTANRHTNVTSLLLLLGGVIWIIHYLLQIVIGTYGIHAHSLEISYAFIVGLVFSAALVCLNTGLIRLSYQLRKQSAGWSYAGMAFATIALSGTMAGLLVNVLAGGHVGIMGVTGVIGSCISATLLAIGALLTRSLPYKQALLLLLIGVCTFPIIILFSIPLPVPDYLKDELPFAISGFAWIVFSILYKDFTQKKS